MGSDNVTGLYNGTGTDVIIFPCVDGKPYSIEFKPIDTLVKLLLSDNIGINLIGDNESESLGNNPVSLNGVCGKAANETQNMIDYLYKFNPEMVTPAFLDKYDAARAQEGEIIKTTGLLTPKELHKYLIRTPSLFPLEGSALMLVRYEASWSGNVMSGGDSVSRDGIGDADIEYRCAPGVVYSVSIQKQKDDHVGYYYERQES